MQTKRIFPLDQELIDQVKHYARGEGKLLPELVSEFDPQQALTDEYLPPLTRVLWSSLEGVQVDECDYWQHLEEKYL